MAKRVLSWIGNIPNEETKQAIEDARNGKVKTINDLDERLVSEKLNVSIQEANEGKTFSKDRNETLDAFLSRLGHV